MVGVGGLIKMEFYKREDKIVRIPDFLLRKSEVWYQIIENGNEKRTLNPTAFVEIESGNNIYYHEFGTVRIPVLNDMLHRSCMEELVKSKAEGDVRIYLRRGIIVSSQIPLDGSFAGIYVEDILEEEIVGRSPYWIKGRVQPTEWSFQPTELLLVNTSKKIHFLKTEQQVLSPFPKKIVQTTF